MPSDQTITDCRISFQRLKPISECMENYEIGDPQEDWPHNVLSTATVAYSCGALYLPGTQQPTHHHSAAELALCQQIAEDADRLMERMDVGMGSE